MSLSRTFDIAQSGLTVYQEALDVTSHNIANASNSDYSRQRAVLTTAPSTQNANLIWGNGTQMQEIQRVRDTLTDQMVRDNNQKYSDNNEHDIILGNIQSLFSEPSNNGLSNTITAFYNSWQQLSVTPNSTALRNNVIQAAQSLSNQVQNINSGMNSIKSDVLNNANSDVTTLNNDLQQIQSLNQQIFAAQNAGQQPNDLMDSRDKLIDEVSNLANINVTYDSGGSAVISVGGSFAVDRSSSSQFSASLVNGKIVIKNSNGTSLSGLSGGELNALTDIYNNKISAYQTSFDQVVNQIMNGVNSQTSAGYTTTNPPQSGINFFDNYNKGVLSINQQVLNDPNMIAASGDGTAGNSDIAVNIGGLINQKDTNGNTVVDNYATLVSQVGSDKQYASNTANSYQLLLNQLQTQKSSYSGVSVDEEMTNVLQYQRAYEASAKIMTIADQMVETLINIVQ